MNSIGIVVLVLLAVQQTVWSQTEITHPFLVRKLRPHGKDFDSFISEAAKLQEYCTKHPDHSICYQFRKIFDQGVMNSLDDILNDILRN